MNKESESILRGHNILLMLSGGQSYNFKMSVLKGNGLLLIKNHTVHFSYPSEKKKKHQDCQNQKSSYKAS